MDGLNTLRSFIKLTGIAIVFAASGCTTAYINIPAQTGDIAVNDPNRDGVINVEVAALSAVIAQQPPGAKYVVKLPAGSSAESHARVVSRLDGNALHRGEGEVASLAIYEVRQIRVRAGRGQVDVIRPSDANNAASAKQLVTAYLVYDVFEGWWSKRIQAWRLPVDQALQQNHQPGDAKKPEPKSDTGADADADADADSKTQDKCPSEIEVEIELESPPTDDSKAGSSKPVAPKPAVSKTAGE